MADKYPTSTTCTMTEITHLMRSTFRGNHRNVSTLYSHHAQEMGLAVAL